MSSNPSFGEGYTDEDLHYAGSRFSDVRTALFANPYQKTWGAWAMHRCQCTKSRWVACCRAYCRSVDHMFFAGSPNKL